MRSSSGGAFGPAASALHDAGSSNTDAAGALRLTCFTSTNTAGGAPAGIICSLMIIPDFVSNHAFTALPSTVTVNTFAAKPLTVSIPASSAPALVSSSFEELEVSNGSPQPPEKVPVPQPLSGWMRSQL